MCLAIPGEVVSLRQQDGLIFGSVRFGAITREVCMQYVPEVQLGEFVLVHVGFAISRVDAEEAALTYKTLEEIGMTSELRDGLDDPDANRSAS